MSEAKKSLIFEATISESELFYQEQIGRGTTADVFRIIWKSRKFGEKIAAAKKISLFGVKDVEKAFGDEIYYLKELDHENIISYYGHLITQTGTQRYLVIVTEFAPNGSLLDYLMKLKERGTQLPPAKKAKWAIQAARGIQYLREKKVLHRDVNPGNFLITKEENLKICDFGIAKNLASTEQTQTIKGYIKFVAPEIYTDGKLSPKADVFAFGIMLWQLETSEEPYAETRNRMQVMWNVGEEKKRPNIPDSCDPILRDLMERCWDADRVNRPSWDGIIGELELFQSSKWICVM